MAQEQPAQVLVCLNGPLHRHAGQSYIVWQTRGCSGYAQGSAVQLGNCA